MYLEQACLPDYSAYLTWYYPQKNDKKPTKSWLKCIS
jgi:hypothetical protein